MIGVAVVLVLGIALLLRRVNSERTRGRVVATAPDATAPRPPNAPGPRRTPTWRADLADDEPSEDLAYKSDPTAPVIEDTADQWARIDFDEIRRALPDSTYWKMAFPTKDPAVLAERERIRAEWNTQFGKVQSNTATDEEIDAYYADQIERVRIQTSGRAQQVRQRPGARYGNVRNRRSVQRS